MTLGLSMHIGAGDSPEGCEANNAAGPSRQTGRDNADAQTQMAAFSFGGSARPSRGATSESRETRSQGEIQKDFRFGTCPPTLAPPSPPTHPVSRISSRPSPLSSRSPSYALDQLPSPTLQAGQSGAASELTATPTIEYGAFEYPTIPSAPTSPTLASSREPPSAAGPAYRGTRGSIESPISPIGGLLLGESHRRNSIIARPYGSVGSIAGSAYRMPTGTRSAQHTPTASIAVPSSPPLAKRSITCSNITTVPASGQRPSILHSATMAVGEDVTSLTMAQNVGGDYKQESGEDELGDARGPTAEHESIPTSSGEEGQRPGLVHFASSSSSTATITASSPRPLSTTNTGTIHSRRRTSLMFQPKALPSPIPPSLLARRGSLPHGGTTRSAGTNAAGTTRADSALLRASFSGLQTYGGMRDVTSHRLYHRKESLVAVDPAPGQVRDGTASGTRREQVTKGETQGGRSEEGVAVQVGPGLMAVPADQETHDSVTPVRQRRSSVPHSLRSTIRSPAQSFARPEHGSKQTSGDRHPYPTNEDTIYPDQDQDSHRKAFRARYASYDRAYRPAFSRNLSSSDESDELHLEDRSDVHLDSGGYSKEDEGDGEGETDEVESLPTPGLDTLVDGLSLGGHSAPTGAGGEVEKNADRIRVQGADDVEDAGIGELERPGLEERGSDETVKGVEGIKGVTTSDLQGI